MKFGSQALGLQRRKENLSNGSFLKQNTNPMKTQKPALLLLRFMRLYKAFMLSDRFFSSRYSMDQISRAEQNH